MRKQNDKNLEILEKKMRANKLTTLDGKDLLTGIGGKVSNWKRMENGI